MEDGCAESTQGKGQVSPVEKVRLRVSAMISSPQAQAERRGVNLEGAGGFGRGLAAVLEELAETDGLEMSLAEDGVVTLTWGGGRRGGR
ncbi:DUF1654 domain-containing protein [Pseudomonas aeruginosa]|uniref:DUF1654 domain-containing protein n=1 Tax=Pseudomonas aeruginosa TaxID=287 RepID=UPI003D29CD8A